ncbi:abortive infection family protein [Schaalia sp. ZJ1691]|uniref:abortive infection family protein n=1 Tax=Schaalia sp. ZJ1691 TaxID=2709404 RepID=UPI0013EC8507|nr:abortive infection family protein [Schaalia sp. ZJ1691]
MTGHEIAEIIQALGGFGGLGAMIASFITTKKIKTVKADTEQLRPNHGSTVADSIRRIEDSVHSVGHQIGEVRTDLADERRDRRAWDESLSDRVQALESKRR